MATFLICTVIASVAIAQPTANTPAPSTPLLTELNRETQSLYRDVQTGIARVQLPAPKWLSELADRDNPLHKWDASLDPQVKEALRRDRESFDHGVTGEVTAIVSPAATQPAVRPAASSSSPAAANETDSNSWQMQTADNGEVMIFRSAGSGNAIIQIHSGGQRDAAGRILPNDGLDLTLKPASSFAPNNVALVLDDRGHLLVPIYLEKEAIGAGAVNVMVGDAGPVPARFVGSDLQTNLTILKLEKPLGRPVRLGANRPADGSLVLLLQPNTGSGRLVVWTGGQQEYGVAAAADGSILGFARYGQFLSVAACKPVIDQLISTGHVRRARLGVVVREVPIPDPLRQTTPALGDRPALRIEQVAPESAASAAGLKPGDLILSLADQPVGDTPNFAAAIAGRTGKTPMKILRGNLEIAVSVDLRAE